MSAPSLVNTQVEFHPVDNGAKLRRERYDLRRVVSRILGFKERAGRCGCKAVSASIDLVKKEGCIGITGVETCGSIWACPVCAAKIAEKRRKEVYKAITAHWASGGRAYMSAFTAPHYQGQGCRNLKRRIAKSFTKLLQGKRWIRIKEEFGISGFIRALEVTYGKNGWHPHIHVLWFMDTPLDEETLEELEGVLFERWAKIIERDDGGICNRDVFQLELASTPDAAGNYVAKWGADSELTQLHLKTAKGGGMSPWQLLEEAKRGGARSAKLFREFYFAFKGARQLTWSKGLKKRYKVDEKTDEEIAEEQEQHSEIVATIAKSDYLKVYRLGLIPDLLEAAEKGGEVAVMAFLRSIEQGAYTTILKERRYRWLPDIPSEGQNEEGFTG